MIVLVGKTCSGKSTVANILESKFNIPRVHTYSTRPPREGESNEYKFVSDEQFEDLKSENFFFETTQYKVANGETWKYGTSKDAFSKNCCIVMNPDGVKKIHRMLPDEYNVKIIYLNVSEGVQWNRLKGRELKEEDSTPDEASRRIEADRNDFANIDNYYDYAITTDNKLAEDVAFQIYLLDRISV